MSIDTEHPFTTNEAIKEKQSRAFSVIYFAISSQPEYKHITIDNECITNSYSLLFGLSRSIQNDKLEALVSDLSNTANINGISANKLTLFSDIYKALSDIKSLSGINATILNSHQQGLANRIKRFIDGSNSDLNVINSAITNISRALSQKTKNQ